MVERIISSLAKITDLKVVEYEHILDQLLIRPISIIPIQPIYPSVKNATMLTLRGINKNSVISSIQSYDNAINLDELNNF